MNRPPHLGRSTALFVLTFWLAAGWGGCQRPEPAIRVSPRATPARLPRAIRAVWVARFHYRYADDVRAIMRNCAQLGFNTVLWQVRGDGTVAYPSQIEPWSREFDFRDPGFDPLALAVAEAHRHGMRIEAWVNVLPGWRGPDPPPLGAQLWNAHPEWFIRDSAGRRQALGDFYAILNPCLPEVRGHIVRLCREIVTRYAVDGLHLDYVRYAWETTPEAKERFPADEATLAAYRRATGLRPAENRERWDAWRAEQLTTLVASIRQMLDRERPGATLTAAVAPDPALAYARYLQSGADWLRVGLLDAVMPMAYSTDAREVGQSVTAYRRGAPGRRVVPGIGAYKLGAGQIREQLRQCVESGGDVAVFSYTSFHPTAEDRARPLSAAEQRMRVVRRDALRWALQGGADG